MATIQPDVLIHADNVIRESPHGAKRAEAERLAASLGVSVGTLYRLIKEVRPRRRKARCDRKAERKTGLTDMVKTVMRLEGQQPEGDTRRIPSGDLIKIAEGLGKVPAGALTASSFNRISRERGLAKSRRAFVRVQAEHANEVHVIDFSSSKYFAVDRRDNGLGDWVLRKRRPGDAGTYCNKDEKGPRCWVASITDDHSGVTIARYFIAPGESFLEGLDFVKWVWGGPEGTIFKGLPEVIYGDQGSFLKTGATHALCDALGVRILMAEQYHPWAKGKIEAGFRWLWPKFELVLYTLAPDEITLGELNAHLLGHLEAKNRLPHRLWRKRDKAGVYIESLQRCGVLMPPDDVEKHAFKIIERQVRDRMIQLDGTAWEIVGGAPEGEKVQVFKNALGEIRVRTRDGEIKECREFTPLAFGKYWGPKKSEREKLLEEESGLSGQSGQTAQDPMTAAPWNQAQGGEKGNVIMFPARETGVVAESVFSEREPESYDGLESAREGFCKRLGISWPEIEREPEVASIVLTKLKLSLIKADVEEYADFCRGQIAK